MADRSGRGRLPACGRVTGLAVVLAAACLAGAAVGQEARRFESRLKAALEDESDACTRVERLLHTAAVTREQRDACYRHLAPLLSRGASPLTAVEREKVAELRTRSLPVAETLIGRYVIVLATRAFAENARRLDLLSHLDLAYVALRRLHAVDPVQRVGHRYLLFPDAENHGPHHINPPNLRISIPTGAAAEAGALDVFIHEIDHGFGYFHPARHLFAAAFFEGWADLAPAFVADELAVLGPPFAGRLEAFIDRFAAVGRDQYLRTRLPVEEIVNYDPASSLLMRLARTGATSRRPVDWEPLVRLMARTAKSAPARIPDFLWPTWLGVRLEDAFGAAAARPVLREYRFPLDRWDRDSLSWHLAAPDGAPPPGEPVGAWEVLGPIPDPRGARLDRDPIDAANGAWRPGHEIDGKAHRWRDDVPMDAWGRVALSSLPASDGPCTFYLRTTLRSAAAGPCTFFVASDDDVALWIDGRRVHEFRGNRGTDPRNPDRVFVSLPRGGARIVAQVANHGGPAGFALRIGKDSPYRRAYARALASKDADERAATVDFVASRRTGDEQIVPLLAAALHDADADVRARAAGGLAGRRNHRDVVPTLLDAWDREKDGRARDAISRAVEVACCRETGGRAACRAWWSRNRKLVEASYFAECEEAVSGGRFLGGYYGWNAGCYGGQCVARDWGARREHRLGLFVDVRSPRSTELAVRYACADRGARLSFELRRGGRTVWRADGVRLAPTASWTSWSWLRVPMGELEPGRYRLDVVDPVGSPDLDIVGVRPPAGVSRSRRR